MTIVNQLWQLLIRYGFANLLVYGLLLIPIICAALGWDGMGKWFATGFFMTIPAIILTFIASIFVKDDNTRLLFCTILWLIITTWAHFSLHSTI